MAVAAARKTAQTPVPSIRKPAPSPPPASRVHGSSRRETVLGPPPIRMTPHIAAPKLPETAKWTAVSSVPAGVQPSGTISSPNDPAESEAGTVSKKIMNMTVPENSVTYVSAGNDGVFRLRTNQQAQNIARSTSSGRGGKSAGPSPAAPNVTASIQSSMAAGSPLPLGVRRFMEPRFRADFSRVKIHTGDNAAKLNNQLNAQAFATGNHIFFGKDKFRPDSQEGKELIAHELTHTVQQGAVIQRSEEVSISQQSPPMIQRWGLSPLDKIAEKANLIPGFRMFTVILGMNPINMNRVERSAANIMRALVEFIPGGGLITQALDNYGIFDKVGTWVELKIRALGLVGSSIKQALTEFIGTLKLSDIGDLGGVWERAKRIFTDPIDRIINLAKGLVSEIVQFIKDAVLLPLAKLAQGTRGYDLLCAVLGKDPVTGEAVPQTADVLIGGFMKFIGQEEVWANMKTANAVPRAFAWFKGAISSLMGFVKQITTLFVNALKSLELVDIILVPRAFGKVILVFGGFVGTFLTWAGNAVWNLLEIIFDVVSPGAFGYIKRTGAALKSILKNPLPFVGNLVRAAKLGFQNFADHFGTHLKTGLIDWLTGSLPGVYIPKAFEMGEIVKFVFSVLGISWQNIRQKLVKVVGETAVAAMETGFDIVVTLVTQGPAAAWEKIKDQLANLKDMVIGGITDFVIDTVVKKAVPKLIAMFIPGAGFISAILSIYDTVMVFVNKISKIIQVVTGFINSIVAIAAGKIDAAAERVETTLAGLLSLAINFLAGFFGLGKVADKVMGVINKVRDTIDKALNALINWIVTLAKKFWKTAAGAVANWRKSRKKFSTSDGEGHTLSMRGEGRNVQLIIESDPVPYVIFIKNLKSDKKMEKEAALEIAGKLDEKILDQVKVDSSTGANAKAVDPGGEITKLLDELAKATAPLFPKVEESTPPVYGPLVKGFGSSVRGERLTKKYPKGGSPASASGGLWGSLEKRKGGGKSYYVQGHLLNEKLGGPGNTWSNLTPLTQATNLNSLGSMYRKFEAKLKKSFDGDKGFAVRFTVTASYGRTDRTGEASNVTPVGKRNTIIEILKAEQSVPKSIKCNAVQLYDKNPMVPLNEEIENSIDEKISHYDIKYFKRDYINLNKPGEDLKELNGVDDAMAATIENNRPYKDKQDALTKLGEKTWHQIASTAGTGIRF